MPDEKRETRELIEVGRYALMTEANERSLVVLSLGFGYWLFREGDEHVLCVESRHRDEVVRELEKFEAEVRNRPAQQIEPPVEKMSSISLFVFAWVMGIFFLVQMNAPPWWTDKGEASSEAMLRHGEWWRAVTALTLHADLMHLCANIAVGLLFAAFLLPMLGTGLTWIAILLTGALGNCLNAWGYRGEAHLSIGASTAVFGALGILVSCQIATVLAAHRKVRYWEIVLPVGAGFGFLAYLGVGDEHTDYMAHFWGFVAGNAVGALAVSLRLKERTPRLIQRLLAALGPVCLVAAWVLAGR